MGLVGPNGVNLSKKQTEAWDALSDSVHREVFFGGGAGSTKSTLGCLWQIDRRVRYPGTRGFIGRETYPELRDSTMATYFYVCGEMGWKAGDHYEYNAGDEIVYWANGSETHFRYLQWKPSDPDLHRLGSTEYTDAFVDEAPGVNRRSVQVLKARIRFRLQEYGLIPKMLLTGNPGPGWVRDEFVMNDAGEFIELTPHRARILATLADHPDPVFRAQYEEQLQTLDHYDRARLLYGDWRVGQKPERPFAHMFDSERHVRPTAPNPVDLQHFSIDFNVEPFVCLHARIWTDAKGEHCHVHRELVIKEASITAMAKRILAVCPHRQLIRITGDRNGMSRRIGATDSLPLFEELRRHLGISASQVEVPPNPTHALSREETNFVLAFHPDFAIDPACTKLIADLQTVAVDATGSILKSDRSKAAQQADALDCLRYLIGTRLRQWIKRKRNELRVDGNGRAGQPVRGRTDLASWRDSLGL